MPDMTPVANQVIPPDPTKGINTFSGILGIKQQQQALQLGQQKLAVGQTEVQQSQQKNTELQNLSLFTQGAIKSGKYQLPDGSSDVQAFTKDAMGIAPTYGQEFIGRAASNFKEATESRRSLQALSGEQNKQISDALKGIATKPDATPSDLLDAVSQIRSNNKDPAFNRALDNFLLSASRTSPQQAAANASSSLGGLAQSAPAEVDVGGQIATGTRRTMGEGMGTFNPTGQKIQKTLNPAQTPGYLAQAAAAGAAGTGSTSIDLDRAKEVGNLQQTSSANIELTKQIDRLADDIGSGKVAKIISETGNYLGMSSINQVRSQLIKNLGQVRGAVAARAGSDAKAAEILEGYPTDTTPTQTTHAAMDYVRGTLRQNLARGQLLQQYQKEDPQSVRGFAAADNILGRTTDPLMHEYTALKPEERAGFYRRNFGSAKEAQEFKNRVNATQKHTGILGQ